MFTFSFNPIDCGVGMSNTNKSTEGFTVNDTESLEVLAVILSSKMKARQILIEQLNNINP